MRYWLVAAVFSSPIIVLAQQPRPELGYVNAYTELRCQEGFILTRPALLYRSLRAAQRGQYACRLQTGAHVYVVGEAPYHLPAWLKVVRSTAFVGTVPHRYTDTYYLSRRAITAKDGSWATFRIH